jgi:hypothetical protein
MTYVGKVGELVLPKTSFSYCYSTNIALGRAIAQTAVAGLSWWTSFAPVSVHVGFVALRQVSPSSLFFTCHYHFTLSIHTHITWG